MIDGKTGNYTIPALVKSQDEVTLNCMMISDHCAAPTAVLTQLLPS